MEEKIVVHKFTKEMKKTHTLLIPSMLDFHMPLFEACLISEGYKVEVMQNTSQSVIEEGLKYVHNDTCYPALLVIGQFLDNLKKRNDLHNIALVITQTGGGCRASNYYYLLMKALKKAGYDYIPVIPINLTSLHKTGLKINLRLLRKLIAAITYGDALMYLCNKTRTYEINKGESKNLASRWVDNLKRQFINKKGYQFSSLKKNLNSIANDFNNLNINIKEDTPRVGIVGEIYIKYASLGNNNLEDFLVSQNAEILVPGLYGFMLYCFYNMIYDYKLYKKSKALYLGSKFLISFMEKREKLIIESISKTKFEPMHYFKETKELSNGILSHGTKMGEGWLLTAEMIELIHDGYKNIVCAQPFGCLPNHICGKGVIKTIKTLYPKSNIVAIDYDPSATKVNQENRIKLMLSIAREEFIKKTIVNKK